MTCSGAFGRRFAVMLWTIASVELLRETKSPNVHKHLFICRSSCGGNFSTTVSTPSFPAAYAAVIWLWPKNSG